MNNSSSFDHELDIDLPYKEFELEIESATHELEVEFKQSYDELDAEVEYEQDGYKEMELTGVAALDHLLPILKNLNIDSSMSEDQIIDSVLTAFDWDRSYDEFELEVSFMDGSYIDIDY